MILSNLIRFGVSIEKKLLEKYDNLIKKSYNNRSEAIRDLIRDKIIENKKKNSNEEVVGSLTLLYDHHQRELTQKMLKIQHKYSSLFTTNLHLHLNKRFCLEVIIVQGIAKELQEVTDKLIGLKGVLHGELTITAPDEDFNTE